MPLSCQGIDVACGMPQKTRPSYCNSWGYIVGDILDDTGNLSQKVGTVAVAAGVVQVAVSPATAGTTAVTGGGTIAGGTAMIGFGAALQTIGKFTKFVAAGGARNSSYFAADTAASSITLVPSLSGRPTYALASQVGFGRNAVSG